MRLMRLILVMGVTLVLIFVATRNAHAKEDVVALTGCVRGFAQGGYFFSDVVNDKGKVKHYLLVNNNDEMKQYEGQIVKVSGTPAPFGWSVTFTTDDKRTLKTSSVFGVDEVEPVQPSCRPAGQMALR